MKKLIEKLKNCNRVYFVALKYVFAMILPLLFLLRSGKSGYILVAAGELFLILLLTEVICGRSRTAAWLVNSLLILIMVLQNGVLYFGNTFLSFSMLDNLSSLEDISGKFYIYIPLILLVLVLSFLPVTDLPFFARLEILIGAAFAREDGGVFSRKERGQRLLTGVLGLLLGIYVLMWVSDSEMVVFVMEHSPYYSLHEVMQQKIEQERMREEIQRQVEENRRRAEEAQAAAEAEAEAEAAEQAAQAEQKRLRIAENIQSLSASEFFRDKVEDHVTRPANLKERPNIILVFAEGTSQAIADDPREIMPNLVQLESESLIFDRYYNHTFATYMGLSGQLYSGYQQANLDPNVLVSLQDVLSLSGYHTIMVNTEPDNQEFSDYLDRFDFDEVITSEKRNGMVDSVSDKDAFEFLFDQAMERDEAEEPFFLCIYTFGTHVNLDSPDEKFGDGKNFTLNRAANLDTWLGEFMEKFRKSELHEDTLFVFTSDHASYMDADYTAAGLRSNHVCCNEIPLVFYYGGVQPEVVDAAGRNSLDLVPTILDYLDISAGNCFIGDSLFAPLESNGLPQKTCEATFQSGGTVLCTAGGLLANNPYAMYRADFDELLKKYWTLKLTGAMTEVVE